MKTLEQYQKELAVFGMRQKLLEKLVRIVRHNPDYYCFMIKDVTPATSVSPVLVAQAKSKPLINVLKKLQIYNMVCTEYHLQDKVWKFSAFSNKGRTFEVEVQRDEFHKAITFEDAVSVALMRIHEAIMTFRIAQNNHTLYLESEVDYGHPAVQVAGDIAQQLNELNALASKSNLKI